MERYPQTQRFGVLKRQMADLCRGAGERGRSPKNSGMGAAWIGHRRALLGMWPWQVFERPLVHGALIEAYEDGLRAQRRRKDRDLADQRRVYLVGERVEFQHSAALFPIGPCCLSAESDRSDNR